VNRIGLGTGTVVSDDDQSDCGADQQCTGRYPIGEEVVLSQPGRRRLALRFVVRPLSWRT
jgi:hypothetical protein